MSKRNQVQFSRPEDPKFLKLIKEQIGYKNEPSVDTKVRQGGNERRQTSNTHTQIPNLAYNFVRLCFVVLHFAASKIESRL